MRFAINNRGSTLIEVLAVIVLFAIMALALAKTTIATIVTRGQTEIRALQMQIATEAMEELAGINPINLTDADDATTSLIRNGHDFTRTIDVTVNGDSSRRIDVTVISTNARFGTSKTLSATYAVWGSS